MAVCWLCAGNVLAVCWQFADNILAMSLGAPWGLSGVSLNVMEVTSGVVGPSGSLLEVS